MKSRWLRNLNSFPKKNIYIYCWPEQQERIKGTDEQWTTSIDKAKQKGNYLLATIGCETNPATEFLHTHTAPAPACLDSSASVLQSPLCYQTKASSDPNAECLHGYNLTTPYTEAPLGLVKYLLDKLLSNSVLVREYPSSHNILRRPDSGLFRFK